MVKLVLIGGGGFAKEVHAIAEAAGDTVVGYASPAQTALKLRYLGCVEMLPYLRSEFDAVILAFGAINRKTVLARAATVAALEALGLPFASAISPHAIIAPGVRIGAGSVVAPLVIVSVDATIGDHCVLNGAAQLGHDAVLEPNVSLAPLAFVAGTARVATNSLIGPHTTVLEGRNVGREVIVGAGATVLRDVADGATIAPARYKVIGGVKP
jgi:acetyltransferase EpsM